MTLNIPPKKELVVDRKIALPANPFLVIGYPSSVVIIAEGVPGIFIRQADIEPP